MKLILLPLLGLSAFARRGGEGSTSGVKHCPRKKSATEEYGEGYSLFKEIKCNADGTYEPIQQYADDVRDEGAPEEYVCVSPHSGMVRFELGRNKYSKPCKHEDFNEETLFPNQKSKDDKPCDYARFKVIVRYEEAEKVGRTIMDQSVMQCLDNGLFRPLQYSHMGSYCVASADGAYVGAPSKDANDEDYCPEGEGSKDDDKTVEVEATEAPKANDKKDSGDEEAGNSCINLEIHVDYKYGTRDFADSMDFVKGNSELHTLFCCHIELATLSTVNVTNVLKQKYNRVVLR